MRTIKFRGKSLKDNKWCYGHYSDFNHNPDGLVKMSYWINTLVGGYSIQVNPDTIGQFTELCDKNDKEIYERDILKIPESHFNTEVIGIVKYDKGRFVLISSKSASSWELEHCVSMKSEVIGNIDDNPELLKQIS